MFAAGLAAAIMLLGLVCLPRLPLSQYPNIAPPTVAVGAYFPGASSETLAATVAAPLEQEINGIDGLLYLSSSSTSDGQAVVSATFRPGVDIDKAQVLVQNRVAVAEPRLPDDVRRIGVTVNKQTPGFLLLVALKAEQPGVDLNRFGNYANTTLRDRLLRIPGVAGITVFGGGLYAMRIWIDPGQAAARNLTTNEILAALRAQNIQAAGGSLGLAPSEGALQLPVQVQGRLSTPEEFGDVIIRSDAAGRVVRVRDVARVELGAQNYNMRSYFDGAPGVGVGIVQQPGSNALATARAVRAAMTALEPTLPEGARFIIPYNPTDFVAASVASVRETLIEAIVLVVLVVMLFLRTWRAAVIPILAIPVSLIGAFGVLFALGYSLNSLSLFGLVLAVGIVVDDAIVVVEGIERHIRAGLTAREAAHKTMAEVSGALVAITIVLLAVFLPSALIPGVPGIFYRQFAVTISAASVISLLVSLTLSPALAALLLKPRTSEVLGRRLDRLGSRLNGAYGRLAARLVRAGAIVLVLYVGLVLLTGWRIASTPSGFIPQQDQGYLIGVVQLPPGASLNRTDRVIQRAGDILRGVPGIKGVAAFAGLDGANFTANSAGGVFFIKLDDWHKRGKAQAATTLAGEAIKRLSAIQDANIFVLSPPPVEGLGTAGGFKMMVQDRSGAGYIALEHAAGALMAAAHGEPKSVTGVFSQFSAGSPRLAADIDREKALQLGVQPRDVYETLGAYLGSAYVNDFNLQGRTLRVTAQAEAHSRGDAQDIENLRVRSQSGALVPLGSITTLRNDTGPIRVVRYNLYPAAEVQGSAAPGVSSGQALHAMERLAAKALPPGFGYEWTELARQEKEAGRAVALIFGLAVALVFLVLSAYYEALTLPLAVILIVPLCVLAALLGVNLRGQDNNILTQIGLIVLVALAAKNVILVVEFARKAESGGQSRFDAAVSSAVTRLRPILMTSVAFILGVLPLVYASGPGAEMRRALGTAVFSGMIGVTALGLLFTPVFYVLMRNMAGLLGRRPGQIRPQDPTTDADSAALSDLAAPRKPVAERP